jgi:hypothetical protein
MKIHGTYEGLFVPEGDRRRGRTHCWVCGGRTNQRVDKKAAHQGCVKSGRPRRKGAA